MIYLRGTMWYTDVTRDGRRVRISEVLGVLEKPRFPSREIIATD